MHAVLWRPATPTDEVAVLANLVETLRGADVLSPEQADGLLAKLAAITDKIGRDSSRAAVNQLLAFVHQVEAFVRDGTLSEEDGRILVEAAAALIADLRS
ncbi:MAG TPA: hypothetical protein VLL48_09615 [Longimicrobiales bacterium]|nr:hypothetical protein [Longimicrobiales bacterium]